MDKPEEIEDFIEKEEVEVESTDPEEIKRKIQIVEDELENLSNIEWVYAKRLLKYGLAAWVFGLSAFVSSLIIYQGPEIILNAPPLSFSFLFLAGAAPVIISIILIQRYRKEMDELEKIREKLLSEYESVLLKKVEENIA